MDFAKWWNCIGEGLIPTGLFHLHIFSFKWHFNIIKLLFFKLINEWPYIINSNLFWYINPVQLLSISSLPRTCCPGWPSTSPRPPSVSQKLDKGAPSGDPGSSWESWVLLGILGPPGGPGCSWESWVLLRILGPPEVPGSSWGSWVLLGVLGLSGVVLRGPSGVVLPICAPSICST